MLFAILAAVTLLSSTSAQVTKFGNCPDVKLAENFEPSQYFVGKWYEQKRFWAIFEIGSKCVNAEYTALEGGMVEVKNSGTSLKKGTRFAQKGQAYCLDNPTSNCKVRFYPGTPFGNYNLLAADPNKFGLVYSCRQTIPGFLNTQFAWILTRDKVVSPEDMQSYLNVFKRNGIDTRSFIDTVQDCADN